jgi:chemotaxis protein MotB
VVTLSRRARHDEEHGHDERWLITYADMITLLLAVFIVLYSFSVLDLKKFETVASALGDVFHGPAGGGVLGGSDGILAGGGGIGGNRAALINDIRGAIDGRLSDQLRESITITHRDGVVTVSLRADALTFPAGRADLTEETREILDALGPSLRESHAPVLVEGHTCDLPINTARFPSNWELSAARASGVMVHLIRTCGIEPDHISAVGYADTRPVAPNDSEEGRMRNRRVDIVVLRADEPQRPLDPAGTSEDDGSLRLRPVRIMPEIDLRARYYDHTGRRSVDAPAPTTRREVH